MLRRCLRAVKNLHLWVVVVLFAAGVILHYPQQIIGYGSPSLFSFLGLSRHAIERIFLLLPIGYASFFLGTGAGTASLIIAAVIMLPRVFFISEYFPDALFETIGVLIIGGLINLRFLYYKNERVRRQKMLSDLEESHRQLMSRTKDLEISHQKLKESQDQVIQAEKLTSLGQLAASIAHEVNNPLSSAIIYNQLIAKKIENKEVNTEAILNYTLKIEAELERSAGLIQNLLNFSRRPPTEFQKLNFNSIVTKAYELTAYSAEKNKVRVVNKLDSSLPEMMGDPNQLQQVCINLILNAVQAMPDGGELNLRTYFQSGHVKLEVRDTGVGISRQNMSKLFTPFFSTKPEVKGVGLGLSIVYGIVQRHKGKIEVRSKENEGSTFTVTLPLHPELMGTKE
jgi:signal transduction histidine kinase